MSISILLLEITYIVQGWRKPVKQTTGRLELLFNMLSFCPLLSFFFFQKKKKRNNHYALPSELKGMPPAPAQPRSEPNSLRHSERCPPMHLPTQNPGEGPTCNSRSIWAGGYVRAEGTGVAWVLISIGLLYWDWGHIAFWNGTECNGIKGLV